VILDDESDFAGMNEEWGRWFTTDPPARQGAKLPIRPQGMRISIAVIAVNLALVIMLAASGEVLVSSSR